MLAMADQFGSQRRPWPALLAYGVALAPAAIVLGLSLLPVIEAPVYPLAIALLPLFLIAYRYGWRPATIAYGLLCLALVTATLPQVSSLKPGQLPLLMAMVGCAVLLLGVATENLRNTRIEMEGIVRTLRTRSAELARAANRMAALQEQERRRIGVELHDQIGQDMTAIATRLRIVELTATNPAVLDRFGLARAIAEGSFAELLRDRGVLYTSRVQGPVDRLPDNIASALYRICQEAATNGARHGCGGRMHIRLTLVPSEVAAELTLEIEDQFGPFAVNPDRPGRGLLNIRDRADAIGASYRFDPESGQPRHRLHLWVPIAYPDADPGAQQ
jgi:two-component system sensor histidine kinase UhpB